MATENTQTGMNSTERPVVLIIADISGYTKFMAANVDSLNHSQIIISELIETIIKQVEIPLEVAKLEGDAVFLYAIKNDRAGSWEVVRRRIGEKLVTFFEVFAAKVAELSVSTLCNCNACKHVEQLKLKIVAHSGKALFHRIGKFEELAGIDTIIVHRLLKNSVSEREYILMTEAAYRDIEFPGHMDVQKGTETYEDIGTVGTLLYLPASTREGYIRELKEEYSRKPFVDRVKTATAWTNKVMVNTLGVATGLTPRKHFTNLVVEYKPLNRFVYTVVVGLLTPFLMVVRPIRILFREKRRSNSPQG